MCENDVCADVHLSGQLVLPHGDKKIVTFFDLIQFPILAHPSI